MTTFLRFLTYCVFIFGPSAIIAQVTQTATYNYTGATQTFIVPVGVTSINVNGSGAQGGNTGANGARIIGDFAVTAGDVVTIMVGGQGATQANNVGGGGGGTFIWNTTTGNTLYVAAGGGGGRAGNSNSSQGGVGSATNTPTNSINGSGNATSGASGNGGSGGSAGAGGSSGGGAGWFSNGTNGAATTYVGGGGIRPLLGGNGGSSVNSGCGAIPFGGYGGGGGGGGCSGAGGGGGGYNGGGGGNGWNGSTWGSGAGGGSYNSGSNQVNSAGVQSGNGQVIISYLSPCSPSYTNGCALGDYINNFSTSGGTSNISNLATGCSAGAYGDFTSQTHTSAFGSTVSFSLQSGATYSQGYSIWVDWDQDNVFEANELMWSSSTWTTAVVNGSFDIPFAIPKTSYRMRVRCAYNTIPTDPCANYGFGEVEEYELVVTSPYCSPLFTTGCAVGDQIENFSTTGGTTNITNNGSGCNGTVADFTSLVHTGAEGDTVNFTVQAGPVYAQGFGIWVDVNQNGTFEGAEQLWNSGTWSTAAFNGSFIIPCGSDTGATIMRVVATYNAVPTNPCLSATYGEAEEYTLQLNPDATAPNVITQDINLWLDASGSALITGVDVDNGSSDACGIASLAVNITNFSCVDVGTPVTVTLTVTDSNGNADSATAVVTVLDTVLPNVIAKNVTVILDSLGSVTIPADSMDNGSSDACGILLINANDTVFDCSDVGSPVQVVLNVADVNTNFDTAHAYVTVLDQAIPALHAYNALTVYLDVNGQYTLTSAEMDSASFDACGIAYTLDTFNFDCNNHAAPVMVTLTGTDPSGNTSSDSTLVTVLDTLPPNLVTQNITIALDSFGARLIDSSNVDLGSWDACGIQELWVEQEMFSCADIGVNTLWYYGLDIHGNLDSVSIDITVIDAIAPIIDIIDTFYVSLDSFGFASMTADSIDIGSWDNCGLASIIIDTASFNCGNHGDTLTVTFTATDVNGNVSVDTSIFIINDTIAPAIFAHSDTFYLDSNGVFTFDAIGLNDSTQDACGVDTFYLSDTLVTCASVDSTIDIYFYAVDIYGNVDSQILNITALDTIRPVITCLDSIVVDNDIDVCGAVVEFNWPTATDNCTVDSIVQIDTTGLDSNSFFPVGITQLTYVAYDQSGNTDTCSFIIEVIDWQTPQLLCQSDTLICDSTFTFVYPAYIDNCSGIDVVQVAGIASGDFYPVGSTINRFAVTDSYGNTDTCEYEVFRYDFPSLADAGPDQEKCEEYTGTLAGNTPGVGFGFWSMLVGEASIADSTNPASTISGITVGTTVFEWRIENGVCPIERDTMEIIEYLNPTAANAGLDIILCDTTEAILGAILDTIGTGTWLPASNGTTISDTAAFNSIVTGLSLGTYNYVWKVANGVCPITYDSVQLDVKPYTAVDAGKDRYIFNPSNIALTATSTLQPVTYTWSPASSLLTTDGDSVMAAPRETMDFIVTAETEFGCKTRDTVMVGINIGPVLPTAFTPDGDNYNDVWNLKELESYPGCVVKVYNRWGYEIFTSKGYKDSWDGTYNGEALPSGSYFYVIELNVEEVPPQTGSVTIIK